MQVHASPIITKGYMGRVQLLAEAVRKYVPEPRRADAIEEFSMLIGALGTQIVKDMVENQVEEEIHKYGKEAFCRVNGVPEEEVEAR